MAKKKDEFKKEKEIFLEHIQKSGLRRTAQRDLILEMFLRTEEHLTSEDLYWLVQKDELCRLLVSARLIHTSPAQFFGFKPDDVAERRVIWVQKIDYERSSLIGLNECNSIASADHGPRFHIVNNLSTLSTR